MSVPFLGKRNGPFRSVPFRSVPLYNRQAASPAKLRAKSHSLALCESVCAVFAFRCRCTVNSKNPAARANCHALFLSNGTDGNVATERNGRSVLTILKRNGWKRKLFFEGYCSSQIYVDVKCTLHLEKNDFLHLFTFSIFFSFFVTQ